MYDDTYRWTFCPHDGFDMKTLVIKPGEPPRLVTRLEDLEVVPQ